MAIISVLDILLKGNTTSLDKAVDTSTSRLQALKGTVNAVGAGVQAGVGKVAGQVGGMFSAIRAGVIGPIAALLSLSAIIYKTGERATEIKALSREASILGVSFNFMSTAAALSGTDAETAAHGIQHMLRSIDEARQGSKEATETWRRLGISINDLGGLDTEQQFKRLADGLSKVKDEGERVALAVKVMGRTGAEMLPFLSRGAAGIAQAMERASSLGITLNKEQLASINESNQAWKEMKTAVTGVFTQLSVLLAPIWTAFASQMKEWLIGLIAKIKEWQQAFQNIALIAEFVRANWSSVFQWFSLSVQLTYAEIYNGAVDLFMRRLPTVFSAFMDGWNGMLKAMGERLGEFIGAVYESLMTGNPFRFEAKPLTASWEEAWKKIRDMTPREVSALERQLKGLMDQLDANLWRDFDKFLRERIGGAVAQGGRQIGEAFGEGTKGLRAVERGSAEELKIAAGNNKDLFAVANRQLQEQRGMRAELMRIAQQLQGGIGIARAAV